MYSYYELIQAVNQLSSKLDQLSAYLHSVLTPLLYVVIFAILLKIGFSCIRGYKA